MKRTVFDILLTVVIAIVSVSCSERDNLSLNSAREVELLFALDTENGNMTRAISDGKNAKGQLNLGRNQRPCEFKEKQV